MSVRLCSIRAILPMLTVSGFFSSSPGAPAGAQQGAPAFDAAQMATSLRFRYIGPVGNRTDAVAGVPGDPNTYYAGAASGGVWKTSDGGIHWTPVFDDQPVS